MTTAGYSSSSGYPGIDSSVDELLAERWPPTRWPHQLHHGAELPPRLAQYVHWLSPDAVWRAYTDGDRIGFALAQAAEPLSNDPDAVALEVYFFDSSGVLCAGGIWEFTLQTGWRLGEVVDISAGARRPWSPDIFRQHFGTA
jgi:hypothetical protein